MDGGALLDSLTDWTDESHPNVSVEARQSNNDLMGELRTELLTLLGTTTQVGGGNDGCVSGGIDIVQPMDETLVRQLSPAELSYRLDPTNMVGGGGNSIGFMHKVKIMLGLRKFNQFVDDFEKLRAQINKNMASYELEVSRGKTLTDSIVTDIRQIFLNEKLRVMWLIIKANESQAGTLDVVKTNILDQRIKRVQMEIDRLKVKLAVNVEQAQKVFMVKGILSRKYGATRGALFWAKNNFMDETIAEVTAQEHAYMKLDKEMNYFMKEIEHAKNLKLLEAAAGGKNPEDLTKRQRKEIAEYQKNREKYEKMFAFGETRRDEYEKILTKKENLVTTLNFYKTTLTAGTYLTKKEEMQKLLNNWDLDIGRVYAFISDAIKKGNSYKKDLETLRELVLDNGNNISKLTAGKSEFEGIKKDYDKYLENCDKAFEIQEGVCNALVEIKQKFIELIPDASLLPDMFRVVQAQAFVVSIVNDILAMKQNEFGGTADKGQKYLEDQIKKMKGGAEHESDSMLVTLKQDGGVFINPTNLNEWPQHGPAFFEHSNNDEVWDIEKTGGPGWETASAAPGKSVKILTLPYGLRRISDEYVTRVNQAITDIDSHKRIFIPLLDYENLHKKNCVYILTAVYQPDSGIYRVTGVNPFRLTKFRDYENITGNYYFYNIVEDNGNNADNRAFRDDFKTLCDRLPNIKLDNKSYIVLPMFYKIGEVNNMFFMYDEYVLLHPLLGSVMTATLSETKLERTKAGSPGITNAAEQVGYDFTKTELNLRLKNHSDEITNVADLKANTNNDEYYYNFSGPQIIKKAYVAGSNYFTTQNRSRIDLPGPGPGPGGVPTQINQNLLDAKPGAVNVTLNTHTNLASYANYIFQLTGHLNELIHKITVIKLNYYGGSLNPNFIGSVYADPITYYVRYNIATPTAGRNPLPAVATPLPLLITKIDHIGTDKSWSNDYLDNFFDTHDPSELVWIFHSIKMLIADIIYCIRRGMRSWPLKDATAGASVKLYAGLYKASLTSGGLSPTAAGLVSPGGKAGSPGALSQFNPRFKTFMNYLRNTLPPTSSYFSNLPIMTDIIKKFSAPDYQTYSNLLFQTYDIMQEIRKYETKILDIKAEKDKMPLPEYSLIAKNLEPNVQPGSKDAYTGAGQKLYEKIKENKAYIKQNEFAVNSDNLVNDVQDLLHEIHRMVKVDLEYQNNIFFSTSPGDKFYDTLRSQDGARKLVAQLQNNKFYNERKTLEKICYAMQKLLFLSTKDDAYKIYEAHADKHREYLKTQGKKGKGNKNKKGHTNRKNTH